MVSGRQNSIDCVFAMVQTFSRSQKEGFLKFLGPHSKGENTFLLFDKLQKRKILAQISFGDWERKKILNTASLLLGKCIEYLALERNDSDFQLSKLEIAIEFGVLSYARKLLKTELVKSLEEEGFGRLFELYQVDSFIEDNYNISIVAEAGLLERARFEKEFFLMLKSKKIRKEIGEIINTKPLEDRLKHYHEGEKEISNIIVDYVLKKPRYEMLKALRVWHVEGKRYDLAIEVQLEILNLIDQVPRLIRKQEAFREKIKCAIYQCKVSRFTSAIKLLAEVKEGLDSSEIYCPEIYERWVLYSVVCHALCPEMKKDGVHFEELISRYGKGISKNLKGQVFHALSILFFYEEDWDKVIYWQRKISGCSEMIQDMFGWAKYALRCIAYLEKSDPDNGSNQLDGMFSFIQGNSNEFVHLTYSILEDLVEYPFLDKIPKEKLEEYFRKLDMLSIIPENRAYAGYLNISIWLKSIQLKITVTQIVRTKDCKLIYSAL